MKVVHFTAFAPSKSGMYESTKDQIKYERKEGLESDLIDTFKPENVGLKDDWLETIDWREALKAEIWVAHAGIPEPLKKYLENPQNRAKHKLVAILHGPCENMLLKEYAYELKGMDGEQSFTITHINAIWNNDACVVLNQHEYDISELYDEYNKLIYIPNSIDLERAQPEGYSWPYRYRPAILSADVPRIEKLPTHIIFAMPRVQKKIPQARLNVYSLPMENIIFWRLIFHRSKEWHLIRKCCENVQMKTNTLAPFIRGADIGFNSNFSGILSRVHMEMMAMGVPVVSYNGSYTKYHAKMFDLDSIAKQIVRCWQDLQDTDLKEKTIEYAHKHFSRALHVKQYIQLYERLLGGQSARV